MNFDFVAKRPKFVVYAEHHLKNARGGKTPEMLLICNGTGAALELAKARRGAKETRFIQREAAPYPMIE